MSEDNRRNFLISVGGAIVGSFLMPGAGKAASETTIAAAKAAGISLPPSMEVMELASLPTWGIRHVFPIDKVLPVVHYQNKEGESWAWWPADDEELQAMENFYAATRTPGRPDVSVDEVFPIIRSETEQNLIKGIIDQPFEHQPRLRYAKWLDSQGSAQGELIRIQCQMSQLGSGEKFDELQERETQLFEKHGPEWFRPLAAIGIWPLRGTIFDPSLFIVRGIIDSIFVFGTGVLPRYAQELHQAAPAISTLFLSTRDADVPATVQIPWMNQISHFRLRNEREFVLSDEDLYAMVDSPYLGSLEIFATDSGHVTPESQHLSGDGMGAFCESNLFSQFHILDMDYLEGEASARLSKSTKGTSMSYLEIKMSDFDEDASFSHFRDSLEHMHFTHSKIDPTCLTQMVSGKWSKLLHLNMTGTKIADEGATIIAAGGGLSELQYLSLANTNIGFEGAKALANSPNLRQLKQVMLSYDSVGDEGVAVMKDAFGERATFC